MCNVICIFEGDQHSQVAYYMSLDNRSCCCCRKLGLHVDTVALSAIPLFSQPLLSILGLSTSTQRPHPTHPPFLAPSSAHHSAASASINLGLPSPRFEPPTNPTSNGDVELVLEKHATLLPQLPKNASRPFIGIVVTDDNRGFRAVAHIVHGREFVWPEVRQRPLGRLNSNPVGHLRGVFIISGAEVSL